MAEVAFRPVRQLSEYKGKGASASRENNERNALSILTIRFATRLQYKLSIKT